MHPLLDEVFATKKFTTRTGETVEINSETHQTQCSFLQRIIEENGFKETLEVGFAYGMSTLAICESVAKLGGTHVVLDPAESTFWGGHGIDLIEQSGYSYMMEFRELESAIGLPQLLAEGRKFDFAYVDTIKHFDNTIVDFYFIDKLLKVGGVVVFDDVWAPGIRKAMRFISQLDYYKVYDAYPENKPEPLGKLPKVLNNWSRSSYLIKEEYKTTDSSLGINADCVAFRKTGENQRRYDWHRPF